MNYKKKYMYLGHLFNVIGIFPLSIKNKLFTGH